MSIFYVNAEKDTEGKEFFDKYDLGKFIDGKSNTPAETKQRIRKSIETSSTNVRKV